MAAHRDRLEAPALIGVGAAFDIHAGLVRRAPRFLRRTGLEWTYRLILEPRRLWRRYAVQQPAVRGAGGGAAGGALPAADVARNEAPFLERRSKKPLPD